MTTIFRIFTAQQGSVYNPLQCFVWQTTAGEIDGFQSAGRTEEIRARR